MRCKAFMLVLILVFALVFCPACSALTPTPSPSPTPRGSWDSCGNHIHLSVSGMTSEPKKHLIYSHENGIMADGILMFMPFEEYVGRNEIPTVSRGQLRSARLSTDPYVDSFSYRTDLYRKTEDGLERLEGAYVSPYDLPEGTYLIRMDCSAEHEGAAFRFCYIFWVD